MSSLSVPLNQWSYQQKVLEQSEHGPANLPVHNPTRSFWIDTPNANPLAKVGSEGRLTDDADICIIGSGITGVSAAYHLSKELRSDGASPLKVVILEARDFCSGATGRNGGHLTPATFQHFHQNEKLHGLDEALRSLALENYTVSQILQILRTEGLGDAVDLVQGGHIQLLFTDEEIDAARADFTSAKSAGVDVTHVEWFTKEQMESQHGTSHPAFRFPGSNLWPLKLVTQLYKLAQQSPTLSLNLHTRTPVTAINPILSSPASPSARRWSLITPRGSVSCSYIIHATNAYASHLLPHLAGPKGVIPVRAQIVAVRANATLTELTKAGWGANEHFEYWFPRPVSSDPEKPLVILGGGREVTGPKFELYVDDDSVVNHDVGRALRAFLPSLFPEKYEKGREPEMEWSGIMGYTRLGDPFVGPVLEKSVSRDKYKGQFIAAGYGGHGMPRTFACAQVVAQMIVSEMTEKKWTIPDWLPKHYLTTERLVV